MADVKAHLERNLAQAEALGQTERAKKLKARLAELEDEQVEAEVEEEVKPAAKKAPAKKKADS